MRRKLFLLSSLLLLPQLSSAASFSITGNGRFGTHLIENPDLDGGVRTGATNTTAYMDARFLLRPDVVIDDRFTIRTELILSPTAVVNNQSAQFGTALGNGSSFTVSRAYLDWASDWGVLSVGRMPKNWGLGLLYNSGSSVFDDFQTLRERVAFRALLGNLAVSIAYEKGYEGLLSNSQDDIDAYELSIEYSNPETLFDVGLLYNRGVVMTGAPATLEPSGSAHNLSIYSRKRWNDLQVGGEFLHVNGADSGRVGFLAQVDYMPGVWEWNVDVGLASGSDVTPLSFHPNYRPFLLLFRESIGPTAIDVARGGAGGTMAVGKAIGLGTGNGAFISKLGGSYGFDNKALRFGADVGFATLASQGTNEGKLLGVETDLHLTQKWYDNFDMIYSLGLLIPGGAFGPGQQGSWGMQIRGALTF